MCFSCWKRLGHFYFSDGRKLSVYNKYHVLFDLLFYSGCRIGEALALTASDIDTINRRISITKTYFRHKGKDEITEPKTRESVRTVIIPEFLAEELKAYMASMYKLPADERIFAVVPEAVQHVMKRHADKAGVKYIRVHDLRHPYVKPTTKKYENNSNSSAFQFRLTGYAPAKI